MHYQGPQCRQSALHTCSAPYSQVRLLSSPHHCTAQAPPGCAGDSGEYHCQQQQQEEKIEEEKGGERGPGGRGGEEGEGEEAKEGEGGRRRKRNKRRKRRGGGVEKGGIGVG